MPVDNDDQPDGSMTQFAQADYGMDTGPSAVAIVNLVMKYLSPTSVVDVGCGTGVFLDEFEKRGVNTILGLDGPAAKEVFKPDRSSFLTVDLASPVRLNRRFDLALCLEVAEHLPADSADCLVETLTDLAPVVLFSAAHPSQGGQGHVSHRLVRLGMAVPYAVGIIYMGAVCIGVLTYTVSRVDPNSAWLVTGLIGLTLMVSGGALLRVPVGLPIAKDVRRTDTSG